MIDEDWKADFRAIIAQVVAQSICQVFSTPELEPVVVSRNVAAWCDAMAEERARRRALAPKPLPPARSPPTKKK